MNKELKTFIKENKQVKSNQVNKVYSTMKNDLLEHGQVDLSEYYFTYDFISPKEYDFLHGLAEKELKEGLERTDTDLYVCATHKLMKHKLEESFTFGFDIPFFNLLQDFSRSDNFRLERCLELIKEYNTEFKCNLHNPKAILLEFIKQLKEEFNGCTDIELDCYDTHIIKEICFCICTLIDAIEELY